jgi:hypothetical protein
MGRVLPQEVGSPIEEARSKVSFGVQITRLCLDSKASPAQCELRRAFLFRRLRFFRSVVVWGE